MLFYCHTHSTKNGMTKIHDLFTTSTLWQKSIFDPKMVFEFPSLFVFPKSTFVTVCSNVKGDKKVSTFLLRTLPTQAQGTTLQWLLPEVIINQILTELRSPFSFGSNIRWWVDGSFNEILDRFLRPWGGDKEAQRHDGDWMGRKVLVEN